MLWVKHVWHGEGGHPVMVRSKLAQASEAAQQQPWPSLVQVMFVEV